MKPEVFEAIKRFEIEVKDIVPGSEAKVIETFDDADASLMVIIPALKFELIQKLTKLAIKIEKETGVTLSILPEVKESKVI